MSRAFSVSQWVGRALSLRPADLHALVWAARAVHRLRPELVEHGTHARVPPPSPSIPPYAVRSVALYLRLRRATCFERTLTLQAFLAAHGRPVPIAIGVATEDGFRAHAWLVDVDPSSESTGYQEIKRVPPPAPSVDTGAEDRRQPAASVPRLIAGQLRGALGNPTARRALMMSLPLAVGRRSSAFQPYNDTSDNRYPDVFARLASDRADLTVVSFGCSVGRELLTLREYFPNAQLLGVDASAKNVADTRRLLAGAGERSVHALRATDLSWLPDGSVDLIFAMAVFRHGALTQTHPQSCRPFLGFDAFNGCIADLVRALRSGGTLTVEHSNFRIADSSSAAMLTATTTRPSTPDDVGTPYYGPDDRLRPLPPEREVTFTKLAPIRTGATTPA